MQNRLKSNSPNKSLKGNGMLNQSQLNNTQDNVLSNGDGDQNGTGDQTQGDNIEDGELGMGIKEGEEESIPDLGFDSRFKYDNVMINDKYHITKQNKPQREIRDFNPTVFTRHGIRGHNYLNKYERGDHEIAVSDTNHLFRATKPTHKTTHFSNVEKQDRPFGKNSQQVRQE